MAKVDKFSRSDHCSESGGILGTGLNLVFFVLVHAKLLVLHSHNFFFQLYSLRARLLRNDHLFSPSLSVASTICVTTGIALGLPSVQPKCVSKVFANSGFVAASARSRSSISSGLTAFFPYSSRPVTNFPGETSIRSSGPIPTEETLRFDSRLDNQPISVMTAQHSPIPFYFRIKYFSDAQVLPQSQEPVKDISKPSHRRVKNNARTK